MLFDVFRVWFLWSPFTLRFAHSLFQSLIKSRTESATKGELQLRTLQLFSSISRAYVFFHCCCVWQQLLVWLLNLYQTNETQNVLTQTRRTTMNVSLILSGGLVAFVSCVTMKMQWQIEFIAPGRRYLT